MTPLRPRLRDALQLRGFSERTQEMAGRAVRPRADSAPKPPDQSTEEALRDACLARQHVTHASRAARPLAWCGITCGSEQTLTRPWTTLPFVRPPRAQQRPVILSLEDVRPMLAHLQLLRSRVCLTPLSSCGLRRPSGTPLQVPASDRARLLVHGHGGTGATDRSGPERPRHGHGNRPHAPEPGAGRLACGAQSQGYPEAGVGPPAAPPLGDPSAGGRRSAAPHAGLFGARLPAPDRPLHPLHHHRRRQGT